MLICHRMLYPYTVGVNIFNAILNKTYWNHKFTINPLFVCIYSKLLQEVNIAAKTFIKTVINIIQL